MVVHAFQMLFSLFLCKISIISYALILLFLIFKYLYSVRGSFRYYVARWFFYAGLFLSGLFFAPLFLFSPGNVKNSMYFAHYVGRHLDYFFGVTWNYKGICHIADSKGAVLIANHQHELDIIGMFTFWHIMDKCAAIAKRELFWNPFGVAAWLAGVVFINRSNPETSHKALNKTASVLHNGTKIFIFPEGTRNPDIVKTKKFLPFKKGAFRIAIEAQAPIVPVVFSPYYFMDTNRKILDTGGEILVSALPPIPTIGLTLKDMDNFIAQVKQIMEDEYINLSKEVKERFVLKIESDEKKNQYLERLKD